MFIPALIVFLFYVYVIQSVFFAVIFGVSKAKFRSAREYWKAVLYPYHGIGDWQFRRDTEKGVAVYPIEWYCYKGTKGANLYLFFALHVGLFIVPGIMNQLENGYADYSKTAAEMFVMLLMMLAIAFPIVVLLAVQASFLWLLVLLPDTNMKKIARRVDAERKKKAVSDELQQASQSAEEDRTPLD